MAVYSKVTRNGQVTLPAKIRQELGIEEGDILEISIVDEKALLMPKKLIDKSQSYFWTNKWQDGEKQADEDIKARRVKTFDSVEDLLDDLK